VVIVASVRALMMHGGADLKDESTMNSESLKKGFSNLDKHIANMQQYGAPIVVAINRFPTDTQENLDMIAKHCKEVGAEYAPSEVFMKGGKGGTELAKKVVEAVEGNKGKWKPIYDLDIPIKDKINAVATKIYGADGVEYSSKADKTIKQLEMLGYGKLPVCIAKTQASISDDPSKKGAPKGWMLKVREVNISAGAGFIVPICGDMMLMPGLAKAPAALRIDIGKDGRIVGLK